MFTKKYKTNCSQSASEGTKTKDQKVNAYQHHDSASKTLSNRDTVTISVCKIRILAL